MAPRFLSQRKYHWLADVVHVEGRCPHLLRRRRVVATEELLRLVQPHQRVARAVELGEAVLVRPRCSAANTGVDTGLVGVETPLLLKQLRLNILNGRVQERLLSPPVGDLDVDLLVEVVDHPDHAVKGFEERPLRNGCLVLWLGGADVAKHGVVAMGVGGAQGCGGW